MFCNSLKQALPNFLKIMSYYFPNLVRMGVNIKIEVDALR